MKNNLRTAEYCRKGHVDRVADILADSLLDEYIKQDPNSRVAIEVFGCHGIITVGGEVTTKANINILEIVKQVYHEIGYHDEIGIQVNVVKQSPEISGLADTGAGDSGIVTGYATRETKERLPLEVVLAKRICSNMDAMPFLKPDGKVQVTLKDGKIDTLVVSVQGEKGITHHLKKILQSNFPHKELHLTIFQKGGFEADTGLTGRKNILWYGPRIPTGGGAFAGKDPTKVDKSGAYLARKIAIEELERHGYNECLVELTYIIGKSEPLSIKIERDGGGEIYPIGRTLVVSDVIKELNLRQPIYKEASLKGHFGYKGCPWE